MTYSEKLQDPRWQRRRLDVLNLRNWTCEDCASTDKPIQVHHYHYIRGRDPWQYRDDELRVCCRDCHEERQGIEDAIRTALSVIFRAVPNRRLPKFAQSIFASAMMEVHQ